MKGIAYVGTEKLMGTLNIDANTKSKELSSKEGRSLSPYCSDINIRKQQTKHLSDWLAKIYLSTNKNKIDRLLHEMKIDIMRGD